MPLAESIYEASDASGALRQGELVSGLIQRVVDAESLKEGTPRVDRIVHPFVVVVSQGCDLDWDFKARNNAAPESKVIPSVLFCEVTDVESFRASPEMNNKLFQRLKSNADMRYHVLAPVPPSFDRRGHGTPELAIDFKRYFTVPTEDVYRQLSLGDALGVQRRAFLCSPFLENFAQRFYYFQARIALPE